MISSSDNRGAGGKGSRTPTRNRRKIGLLSLEPDSLQQENKKEGAPPTPMTDAAVKGGKDAEKAGIPTSINIRKTSKRKEAKTLPTNDQKQDLNRSKSSLFSEESDDEGNDQAELDELHATGSQHSRVSTQSIIFQLQGTLQKAKREVTKLRLRLRNKTQERDEFKLQAKQTAEMLTMMREQNVKLLKERESFIENITQLKAERDKYHNQARDRSEQIKELKRELSFAKLEAKTAAVERPITRHNSKSDLQRPRRLSQHRDLYEDDDDDFSDDSSSSSSLAEPYDLKYKGAPALKLREQQKGEEVSFLPADSRKQDRDRLPSNKGWKDIGYEAGTSVADLKPSRVPEIAKDLSGKPHHQRSSGHHKHRPRKDESPPARAA